MAARSIASLSLSFGLVSIPIKLYSATENSSAIHFKLMSAAGSRVRQQYVTDAPATAEEPVVEEEPEEPKAASTPRGAVSRVLDFPPSRGELPVTATSQEPPIAAPAVVERSRMANGYEFEKGKFVLFAADELKALEERSKANDRHRRLHPRARSRSDLLPEGVLPRAGQARCQGLQPAASRHARHPSQRVGQVGL